jgi:hypothetical protein
MNPLTSNTMRSGCPPVAGRVVAGRRGRLGRAGSLIVLARHRCNDGVALAANSHDHLNHCTAVRSRRFVSTSATATSGELGRHLGTFEAVVIGLGSMIGAGIFAALAPAARAAGSGLLISLAAAGLVAYCNATSSTRLAARYPRSGGTYVYGRERLGVFWVTSPVGASWAARPHRAQPWPS